MSDTNHDERDVAAEDPMVNEEGNDEVRISFRPYISHSSIARRKKRPNGQR